MRKRNFPGIPVWGLKWNIKRNDLLTERQVFLMKVFHGILIVNVPLNNGLIKKRPKRRTYFIYPSLQHTIVCQMKQIKGISESFIFLEIAKEEEFKKISRRIFLLFMKIYQFSKSRMVSFLRLLFISDKPT